MKIIKIMIAFVLCVAFSLSFSANTAHTSEIFYENEETTVIFSTDSLFSIDKKQIIADKLVFGHNSDDDNNISTYSWCWLTGHDLISETVYVIDHKVRTTVPRCDMKTYKVESCTKCDHVQETLVSSIKYTCCPVD